MDITKKLNVTKVGLGRKPIVFAHGFGCDQNMWRFVAPGFADEHLVVLFDYVGFGASDARAYDANRYAGLSGYADDVLALVRELDLHDVTFVGHSVSSMIGILAALEEPDRFDNLVLVGPSPRYIDDDDYHGGFTRSAIEGLLDALDSNYFGWSSVTAPIIMGNPQRPELAEELVDSFCRADPEIAKRFARVTFLSDNRSDLPRVTTRTLVLQCADDVIAPRVVGEYVHRNVRGSHITHMRATGHCPNLSAPMETIAAIRAFLCAR